MSLNTVLLMVGFKLKMPTMSDVSCTKLMTRMVSLKKVDNSVHSTSVEDGETIVCKLLVKDSGIPNKQMINPVLEHTASMSSGFTLL